MERGTELFAAIHCLVIGASHVVCPGVWVSFFQMLKTKGHPGVFINGWLSLGFGSILVAFHNVWQGLPMILTLLGWAQVLKGALAFTVPALGLRSMSMIETKGELKLRVGGVILFLLGVLFAYLAFR
jgi:hypothetical protein